MKFIIKQLREQKRMSQEELAQKSGVSRTIISGLETGNLDNVTAKSLGKIAQALECKTQDIFFEENV